MEEFYEYPMCDREPLPRWSFGRVSLLGDAAHPMYPVGPNGASQAILDARCVAPLLAETKDVVMALKAYEAERLSVTAKIVQDNRFGGPERVIDVVEERAPMVLQTSIQSRAMSSLKLSSRVTLRWQASTKLR
ncbi:MAG TPA: FAD-dependent monooxygenase [Roseiflexaceae bacterium]